MKIKSSVLFGLVVLICLVGGISLMNRMNDDQGGWRPADMYSTYGGSQGSTYASVSYGSASSADLSVPMLSSSNSLFRRRGAFSYAPASSGFSSQLSIAGTASYSQSPIAYNQGLHTTSSAEFRSFGGGGNAGAVSMSGGSIKSSGFSSTASASVMSVSMPSTSVLAYNGGNTNSNLLTSVSGDIAMAAAREAYAGIGNTTGGTNRASGRRNSAPAFGDPWWRWFDDWMSENGSSYGSDGSYTFNRNTLEQAYNDFINSGVWNDGMSEAPSFIEWLRWYQQYTSENGYYTYNGHTYYWEVLPLGDAWPLIVMLLFYTGYIFFRRRKQKMAVNN